MLGFTDSRLRGASRKLMKAVSQHRKSRPVVFAPDPYSYSMACNGLLESTRHKAPVPESSRDRCGTKVPQVPYDKDVLSTDFPRPDSSDMHVIWTPKLLLLHGLTIA